MRKVFLDTNVILDPLAEYVLSKFETKESALL